MTRQEQLTFCRICHNRQMSKKGLICKLTEAKADFSPSCENFDLDEKERLKRESRDLELTERASANEPFALEEKGVQAGIVGGILMMLGAVVWFFVAYEAGFIFYYPPVLFIIGLVSLIKGLIEGNVSGEKYRK